MGEAEEGPWGKKRVGRDSRVPPNPEAVSGAREQGSPNSERKEAGRPPAGTGGDLGGLAVHATATTAPIPLKPSPQAEGTEGQGG